MALHSLYCADVPLRNCSLTHSCSSSEKWLKSVNICGSYRKIKTKVPLFLDHPVYLPTHVDRNRIRMKTLHIGMVLTSKIITQVAAETVYHAIIKLIKYSFFKPVDIHVCVYLCFSLFLASIVYVAVSV